MPIRPEHRWLYPIDWKQLSAAIRFGRAKGRCEQCGRPHLQHVWSHADGQWWDAALGRWRDGWGRRGEGCSPSRPRLTRVVLACAHLDHNPTNNRRRNLAALCQRCHLAHDRAEHRRRRRRNAFRRRALRDLFD
jgi:hypothetical protein